MEKIHVAIICDGNGRWAKKRFLPRFIGHKKGVKTIKELILHSIELNISEITFFTFSTENWKRPKGEVDYILNLFKTYLDKSEKFFIDNNIQFVHIGNKTSINEQILNQITYLENKTKNNSTIKLNIAFNYGSKDEIVRTIGKINSKNLEINEKNISDNLETSNVDILIRTSGEKRISNFLLWQIAYAELFFIDKHFPEFSKNDYINILQEYKKRNRRFGGI